jgi:hypothetical protein
VPMPRASHFAIYLAPLVLAGGLAWAQEGTPNIPSAVPWKADTHRITGEARFFEGSGNETLALRIRGRMGDSAGAALCFFAMDTRGEDPISGAVRESDLQLLALDFQRLLHDGLRRVGLRAGVELAILGPTGTNTATGAVARQRGVIPSLSVPVEWGDPDDILVIVEPKAVWFDDSIPNSIGGITPGFGDVIALGGGVSQDLGRFTLRGDIAVVLAGDNTIDGNTNRPTRHFVWSTGVSWDAGGEYHPHVDIFITNAAGLTPAMSIIAAPGQSAALGVAISGEF